MKISVVTVSYGDGPLLLRTRRSVLAQQLPEGVEVEHIVVVGDRMPDSPEFAGAKIVWREPKGCYDAINAGLEMCTGDILTLLHGNDVYADDRVLASVAEAFKASDVDFVFGDLYYCKTDGTGCSRYYSSAKFSPRSLRYGFMPPHPAISMRRELYESTGEYNTVYPIAADFDYVLRIFAKRPEVRYSRIPRALVCMTPGGVASKWKNRLFVNLFEKYRIMKSVNGSASYFRLIGRYYYHFFQ